MSSEVITRSYLISGHPLGLFKVKEAASPGIWNDYRQARSVYAISLEKQHDDKPLFHGGVAVEITFFMQLYPSYKKNAPSLGEPHIKRPALFNLFNFIDHVCEGTVYKKSCTITSIKIKKLYDKNPRTEIIITGQM